MSDMSVDKLKCLMDKDETLRSLEANKRLELARFSDDGKRSLQQEYDAIKRKMHEEWERVYALTRLQVRALVHEIVNVTKVLDRMRVERKRVAELVKYNLQRSNEVTYKRISDRWDGKIRRRKEWLMQQALGMERKAVARRIANKVGLSV